MVEGNRPFKRGNRLFRRAAGLVSGASFANHLLIAPSVQFEANTPFLGGLTEVSHLFNHIDGTVAFGALGAVAASALVGIISSYFYHNGKIKAETAAAKKAKVRSAEIRRLLGGKHPSEFVKDALRQRGDNI